MGSGHILGVLFDTLVRIYKDYGYLTLKNRFDRNHNVLPSWASKTSLTHLL